ncbi:speckle-type POZ protein-like [Microplitis mediator]|uniref:speckle-type POZ protein-like n=1 Tax=Microplitis mediator TaxID=375433 RepID=UPI002553F037|nr:speckle-type POZ protein-like [Microplitis mediator]
MERSYTTVDEHHIFYEWLIDKIDTYYIRDGETSDFTVNSSEFSTGAKIKDKWCVRSNICNRSTCSLRGTDGLSSIGFYLDFLNNTDELDPLMKKRDEYFPNNTLTFCLNLTVYDTPVSTSTKLELNIPINQMAHDYTELYNTKMGSDVTINVRNTEFRAHRSILMARSPVLAAMFSHDMIEKKENKISIPDITPEIFEKLLKYIYTDEVNDLDADAERLLEAADKYQLLSLKKMCQVSLSKTLTVNNALKIMTLADLHSAKHLLDFTNKFMASNIKKIVETQNFKEFKKRNPPLAFELLEKFTFLNL